MYSPYGPRQHRALVFLICLCALTYLVGWTVPLMEIDAAQYANISREMLLSKNWLELYDRGRDYLDKPPMLFWLSAISMRLLGIHDWAYRLPSYLFALLSVYSTYRLARLYYQEQKALYCALMLAACQAMFLITHDVRTDTMLMGWVIWGLWQMAEWYRNGQWRHLVWASVALAGGLMTKGPIALMVPVFAFAPHFFLQRNWKQFFRWQYLVMFFIIGLMLLPMSVGLYRQYDLHPEKIMYGRAGTSGLRFFFWTQSFGRITGESTWHENDSFFFLFENMLWGFLPWIIFFVIGLVRRVSELIKGRWRISRQQEWISMGGFLVTYCALGVSKFQLPHYIYVVFPLVAIITGCFVEELCNDERLRKLERVLFIGHCILFSLFGVAVFALLIIPFPPPNFLLILAALVVLGSFIVLLAKHVVPLPRLVVLCVLAMVFINVFGDLGFYRPLLQYQMSIQVTQIIQKQGLDVNRLYVFHTDEERSMNFYNNHFFKHVNSPDSISSGDYLLTSNQGMDSLDKGQFRVLHTGGNFHVTGLSLGFLNPKTRAKETAPYFLLQKK